MRESQISSASDITSTRGAFNREVAKKVRKVRKDSMAGLSDLRGFFFAFFAVKGFSLFMTMV
jgi:hypothetical protein